MRHIIRALVLPAFLACTMTAPVLAQGQMTEGTRLQLATSINTDFHITAATVAPYANHAAVGGKGEAYILHNIRTGTKAGRDLADSDATITAMAFSWDSTMLAVGDSDGFIRVWDVGNEEPLLETDGTIVTNGQDELRAQHRDRGAVTALAWDQDSDTFVASLGDGGIPLIRMRPEGTRGNRPLEQEEAEAPPGPVGHVGPATSPVNTQNVPMSSLTIIEDKIRGVGSGKHHAGGEMEEAPEITSLFSVDGGCAGSSCFEATLNKRYLTSLSFPGFEVAYLAPGSTDLSIHLTINKKLLEKPILVIPLPPNQRSLPQLVNNINALQKLTAEDLTVFDIAFRPYGHNRSEILTVCPRLISLWDYKTGAYSYAHVPEAPVIKAGFENYGDYLYLISKADAPAPANDDDRPAGANAGGAVNEVLRLFFISDKPVTPNAPAG